MLGVTHGYAAIVAGYTPIVLFIGPATGSIVGAWQRVQKTFIGVGIYLLIDNLIFPNRVDTLIRQNVLLSIDNILLIYQDAINAIKCLAEIRQPIGKSDKFSDFNSIEKEEESISFRRTNSMNILQAKFDEITPINEETDNNSYSTYNITMEDNFTKCSRYLALLDININNLELLLKNQKSYLIEVVYDPEIWTRKFPVESYRELHKAFGQLLHVARAVSSGTAALRRVLMGMIEHDEDVLYHLKYYDYMSRQVFAVVKRTTAALSLTSNALHRLYEQNDIKSDLIPLITLSRYFDRLLDEVDHHFKHMFLTRDHPIDANSDFLVTWHNMFESECDLIKALSQLGVALHNIRDVEALSAL